MPLLGKDATTYYSSTLFNGSNATPGTLTWTAVTNISDEADNFNGQKADITTRAQAATGVGASVVVLNDIEVSFTMIKDLSDSTFAALWTALQTPGTPIALLFLSGAKATTSSIGFAANWTFDLNWSKTVKGAQLQNFTASVYQYFEFVTGSVSL